MQDKKSLIHIKSEQSKLLEEAEKLRQLILASNLKHERILKLDHTLDTIVYTISLAYDDKITEYERIGNI